MHPRNQPSPPRLLLQRRPDGSLYAVTGATRTGKTTWVVERVRSRRRLLVWDSAGEFADLHRCERITSIAALARAATDRRARRLGLIVPATPENFEAFCRVAMIFVQLHEDACVVVEELADVTSPNKAPAAWGVLTRRGLRYGPDIYFLTQRPSESDKTSFGNASVIHAHQCALEIDVEYMRRQLRVPFAQMDALAPYEFIERDRRTKSLVTGRTRALTRRARRVSQIPKLATRAG
jgi:hypothetical protein